MNDVTGKEQLPKSHCNLIKFTSGSVCHLYVCQFCGCQLRQDGRDYPSQDTRSDGYTGSLRTNVATKCPQLISSCQTIAGTTFYRKQETLYYIQDEQNNNNKQE